DLIVVVETAASDDVTGFKPPMKVLARAGVAYTKARLLALRRVKYDQAHSERDDGTVAYGTDLARTSPTFYANGVWWKGNQNYAIPKYLEPVDLNTLPDLDNEFGKDKAALYGFFNKAAVGYWCGESPSRLAELRAEILAAAPADRDR